MHLIILKMTALRNWSEQSKQDTRTLKFSLNFYTSFLLAISSYKDLKRQSMRQKHTHARTSAKRFMVYGKKLKRLYLLDEETETTCRASTFEWSISSVMHECMPSRRYVLLCGGGWILEITDTVKILFYFALKPVIFESNILRCPPDQRRPFVRCWLKCHAVFKF